MSETNDSPTEVVLLPGVGSVVANAEAGTLTPRSTRVADALGFGKKRAKTNDDRYKHLFERRRFEAYATKRVGRPEKGWTWKKSAQA